MVRFFWQFSYAEPPCVKSYLDKRPGIIINVHFLHFGVILFLITCASSWCISLLTKPIPYKHIRGLTFFTKNDPNDPIPMEQDEEEEEENKPKEVEKLDNNDEEKDEQEQEQSAGLFKTILYWICGVEASLKKNKGNNNNNDNVKYKIDTTINQTKFESNMCDLNAIIAMALCAFCYAFFNKFPD